jgi:CRP-like cAMP-binding protein
MLAFNKTHLVAPFRTFDTDRHGRVPKRVPLIASKSSKSAGPMVPVSTVLPSVLNRQERKHARQVTNDPNVSEAASVVHRGKTAIHKHVKKREEREAVVQSKTEFKTSIHVDRDADASSYSQLNTRLEHKAMNALIMRRLRLIDPVEAERQRALAAERQERTRKAHQKNTQVADRSHAAMTIKWIAQGAKKRGKNVIGFDGSMGVASNTQAGDSAPSTGGSAVGRPGKAKEKKKKKERVGGICKNKNKTTENVFAEQVFCSPTLRANEQGGTQNALWRPKWLQEQDDFQQLCSVDVDLMVMAALKKPPDQRIHLENAKLTEWVCSVPYFECKPELFRSLVHKILHVERHPKGSVIYEQGKVGQRMLILVQGTCKSVSDETVLQVPSSNARLAGHGRGRRERRALNSSASTHLLMQNRIQDVQKRVSVAKGGREVVSKRRGRASNRRQGVFVADQLSQLQEQVDKEREVKNERKSKRKSGGARQGSYRSQILGLKRASGKSIAQQGQRTQFSTQAGTKVLSVGAAFGMKQRTNELEGVRKRLLGASLGKRLWQKVRHRCLRNPHRGGLMHELTRLRERTRQETVTALTDVSLIRVSYDDLDRLQQEYHELQALDIYRDIKCFDFFSNWHMPVLLQLANVMEIHQFDAGEWLTREGFPPNKIFFIRDGCVQLYKDVESFSYHRWPVSKDRWQITSSSHVRQEKIAIRSDREFFGEESLFGVPCDFSARATTKINCFVLPQEGFLRLFQDHTLQLFRRRVLKARGRALHQIHRSFQNTVSRDLRTGGVVSSAPHTRLHGAKHQADGASKGFLTREEREEREGSGLHVLETNVNVKALEREEICEAPRGEVMVVYKPKVGRHESYAAYAKMEQWKIDSGQVAGEIKRVDKEKRTVRTKKHIEDASFHGRGSGSTARVYFKPFTLVGGRKENLFEVGQEEP